MKYIALIVCLFFVYLLNRYLYKKALKEPFSRVKCLHQNRYLKVFDIVATCETTIEVCEDCGEKLTEPKTDCR